MSVCPVLTCSVSPTEAGLALYQHICLKASSESGVLSRALPVYWPSTTVRGVGALPVVHAAAPAWVRGGGGAGCGSSVPSSLAGLPTHRHPVSFLSSLLQDGVFPGGCDGLYQAPAGVDSWLAPTPFHWGHPGVTSRSRSLFTHHVRI